MKVKIDTKEKMHVVTLETSQLTANMTEELQKTLLDLLENPVQNVIVNFSNIESMDLHAARVLAGVQQQFYDNNHSMVFCGFQKQVTDVLDKNELLEIMNVTPTESEAWDIVQMEEIEREYL